MSDKIDVTGNKNNTANTDIRGNGVINAGGNITVGGDIIIGTQSEKKAGVEGYNENENLLVKIGLWILNVLAGNDPTKIYAYLSVIGIVPVIIWSVISYFILQIYWVWIFVIAVIIISIPIGLYYLFEERRCPQCKQNLSMETTSITVRKSIETKEGKEQLKDQDLICKKCGYKKTISKKYSIPNKLN